ncbi:hypothetical protein DITRI_Ditri07aG0036100 [Diplodiscus trichospermus]
MANLQQSSLKVVEDVSHVSPPPGSVPTTVLPLTFFDIMFLGSSGSPIRCLFFYEFPFPTLHFMQTTLPNLKTSLSLTLQHFFPYAGNLVFPPPPQTPYILYTEGDSVSFVVNESTEDFNYLIGDHARNLQEIQALVPELPPGTACDLSSNGSSTGCIQKPLMAIQVTVFPNLGISIGVAYCHIAGDGRTFSDFMKSWASIHRTQGDLTCLNNYLPDFNRDSVKDPLGLASLFMKAKWELRNSSNVPVHKVRVTFSIKCSQIELLKDWIRKKCMEENGSKPLRVSTFVVTCAYMWVCLIKLQESGAQRLSSGDSNSLSYFQFSADCRDHLKFPATYFGNCLILRFAAAKKSELIGENGILVAATAIGREVMELVKEPFKGAETSLSKTIELFEMGKDVILLSGSANSAVYKADFGWGKARKIELANIGLLGSVSMLSIIESREEEGGVEFGLAFAPDEVYRFNAIFFSGLSKLIKLLCKL